MSKSGRSRRGLLELTGNRRFSRNQPPTQYRAGKSHQPPQSSNRRSTSWQRFIEVAPWWAKLGTFGTILTTLFATWKLWPTITIDPVPFYAGNDPLVAEFTFANRGNVPVYDLRIHCLIDTRQTGQVFLRDNAGHLSLDSVASQIVPQFSPGDTLSRSCGSYGVAGGLKYPAEFNIEVKFRWPLPWWWKHATKRQFSSRAEGTGQAYIVTDE